MRLLLILCCISESASRSVTFSNALPRITASGSLPHWNLSGSIVDSHSNLIVEVNGTFFLYGEYHANGHNEASDSPLPKLSVYTSSDMHTWHFGGLLHNNTRATWGPAAAKMNFWCPDAVWDAERSRMVLYFTNQGSAGEARWGVATSTDGVHFELSTLEARSSQSGTVGGSVDGNALLIDDDGTGYIAYATVGAGGNRSADHMVSIDLLTADLLSSSVQLAAPIFPDSFVEGVMFFKRAGWYYIIYSSCCCCCTAGAGAVVFRAAAISGPWVRQTLDVNCNNDTAPICAGMPAPLQLGRPSGQLIIGAQGFSVARLRGEMAGDEAATYLWSGERWLSGPFSPSLQCVGDCEPATGVCSRDPRFRKGHQFSYWSPLEFDSSGNVKRFESFQKQVTLDLAGK